MRTTLILFSGVFIASWSSILIRLIGPVDAVTIAFYRLLFSASVLLPVTIHTHGLNLRIFQRHLLTLIAAGVFLALHFYTWISSLQMTTVGNSIFLESTHPLFGLILSIIILKEKSKRTLWPAFILGMAGMYFMVSIDLQGNYQALAGDFLALISAFCIAAYLIIARKLKNEVPLFPYLFAVYGVAAGLLLVPLALQRITFWELEYKTWGLLLLLALGPNLLGHSLLNWASRKMPVFQVNMALLSESVLATSYAAILLGELPHHQFYIGAVFILVASGSVFLSKKNS